MMLVKGHAISTAEFIFASPLPSWSGLSSSIISTLSFLSSDWLSLWRSITIVGFWRLEFVATWADCSICGLVTSVLASDYGSRGVCPEQADEFFLSAGSKESLLILSWIRFWSCSSLSILSSWGSDYVSIGSGSSSGCILIARKLHIGVSSVESRSDWGNRFTAMMVYPSGIL